MDKVKFDQVNSVGIGGGDHLVRQHKDSGRKIPWSNKTLMSGAQGKKAHKCLKGGKGSHSKTSYE